MEISKLREFGLSDKEARIYVAALELGHANVQSISKKSKVKRTSVYESIDSLKEKGLLSTHLKKKSKYYTATDPRDLEYKMDERKRTVSSIIPELISIANLIDKKPKIRFFEGEEGIKEIYLDTLKYPKNHIYAWVSDEVWQFLDSEFLNKYIENRARHGIFAFVIAPDTKIIHDYKTKDQKSFRKTLLEKNNLFDVDAEIDLYGDRNVGIMIFGEKIGIVIESKRLYNTLKSIFSVHWQGLGGEI